MKIELIKGRIGQQVKGALAVSTSFDEAGRISVAIPGYADTFFFGYHLQLGSELPEFTALDGKRTIWLPVVGFKDDSWYDGPLAVTEADGTISSYIPTGTSGSLLLAPDGTAAKGWEADRISKIEGPRGEQLLRGCIAAARKRAEQYTTERLCLRLPADAFADLTSDEVLVRLAILRAALGPDRPLTIVHDGSKKISPRLRRFCEHTAIGLSSWDEPDCDLDAVFSWFEPEWTKDILGAINAFGDIIPV